MYIEQFSFDETNKYTNKFSCKFVFLCILQSKNSKKLCSVDDDINK